jgi:hypothetical protein
MVSDPVIFRLYTHVAMFDFVRLNVLTTILSQTTCFLKLVWGRAKAKSPQLVQNKKGWDDYERKI